MSYIVVILGCEHFTMYFFQSILWDWCSSVFVEWTVVSSEVKLFMNVNFLVAEN
jgi:hypothetical protein